MTEKSKYPYQDLTDRDKEVIDKSVLNYLLGYYGMMKRYPHPKKFVIKEGFKLFSSGKVTLTLFSLISIKENPENIPIRPKDLKKSLTDKLSNQLTLSDEIANQIKKISNGLSSRALNETVLKKLKKEGTLHNILGEETYKKFFSNTPGRQPKDRAEDHGGKRSIYIVDEEIEQLKKTLKNPKSMEYLYDKLLKNGLLNRIIKYCLIIFLYLIKSNESVFLQILIQGNEVTKTELPKKDMDDITPFYNQLRIMGDEQIEIESDKLANSLVNEKEFFFMIVPLFGFINPD
jgi:hypothetical protein